jgi:hypothetical protein
VGLVPPASVELIELAGIAVFGVPLRGANAVVVVDFKTVVEVMPAPQTLFDVPLSMSPP